MVGPAEAAKDPANRIVDFPQPGRIQDQFALDARRQRSFEPAVGKRHSETVGKRQVVAGTTKLVFHQLDDVVHAALRLRERVLVEQTVFTADVADPLPAVEQERAAFDLDEQQAVLRIEQHEIAFDLHDGACAGAAESAEAVEDLDSVGEALDQGSGDGAFAGVVDLGGVEGGEEFSDAVPPSALRALQRPILYQERKPKTNHESPTQCVRQPRRAQFLTSVDSYNSGLRR